MMNTKLADALVARNKGWPVFPCKVDKRPFTAHGFKDASSDREQIIQWWEQWPEASIGIPTGSVSGLLVLDLDPRNGGEASLAHLEHHYGRLPSTYAVRTGGGGAHWYFLLPAGVTIASGAHRLGPGLDVKAEGGYVIGAGSAHPSGATYLVTAAVPVAPLPEWLLLLLTTAPPPSGNGHAPPSSLVTEGGRNSLLASLAGTMRRKGMSRDAITVALRVENLARCQPPLTADEVTRIAASIARYTPEPEVIPVDAPSLLVQRFTDVGNAERLMACAGESLAFVPGWKKWVSWDAPIWNVEGEHIVMRCAKRMVRLLIQEAGKSASTAATVEDEGARKAKTERAAAALKWAMQSESSKQLRACIDLTKELVVKSADLFDASPWLVTYERGTIDCSTGETRRASAADYMTKMTPIALDMDASCPQWEAFLESIFAGNQALIQWIWKAVGYTLTGLTREQLFFLCYGTGSNGKSTFFHILSLLLGDYGAATPFATFKPQRSETIRNDIAALRGCRFVSAIESNIGSRLSEDVMKTMCGEDKITARFLHGEYFSFMPQFKVWLAVNHKPVIKDDSHAMWRRVCLVPFTVTIPDEEQDQELRSKLAKELPGILAWAVRGCQEWQREGLKPLPVAVAVATLEYRLESDRAAEFVSEECQKIDGMSTPMGALYEAFCKWSLAQGDKEPMSLTAFGTALTRQGFVVDRDSVTRRKIRKGIVLRMPSP